MTYMQHGAIGLASIVVAFVMTILLLVFALFGITALLEAANERPAQIEGTVTKVTNGVAEIVTDDGTIRIPVSDLPVPVEAGYYISVEVYERH